MPITPSCQSAPATAYARRARVSARPRLDLGDGLAEDPPLDGLALAVQLLERTGEAAGLGLVLGEEQLERLSRVPEAARRVEAGCEPETHGPGVDGGRVDAGALHERP